MSTFWITYYEELQYALTVHTTCQFVENGVLAFTDEAGSIITWLYRTNGSFEWTHQLRTCVSNLGTAADLLAQLSVYRPFTAYLGSSPLLVAAITDETVLKRVWCGSIISSKREVEDAVSALRAHVLKSDEKCFGDDESTVANNRALYSEAPRALSSDDCVVPKLLQILVPNVQKHVGLMWGVLEQFIERATRPFQIAPIMPTGSTERAVIDELISSAYHHYAGSAPVESTTDQVFNWIIDSLLVGQQKVLFINSTRHRAHYYTATLPSCTGVFVLPVEQREHPIFDEAPRFAATLINLMLGEPLGRPVNEWAISQNVNATYMGERAMRAVISEGNVLHECVKHLSTRYEESLINTRIRETMCIISGASIQTSCILDKVGISTFSEYGALDHAVLVRHVCDRTYVYSGVEEYVVEHNGRRLELGPTHNGKSILLRWTDLVVAPPERDYYLNEHIMAAVINSADDTVSHTIVTALAREGGVTAADVYFNLTIFLSRQLTDHLMLALAQTLKISAGRSTPPWSEYHAVVQKGDSVSLESVRQITLLYILRELGGIEIHGNDHMNILNIGRRICVIIPVRSAIAPHNTIGMVIYDEKDDTFVVAPKEAREAMWPYINDILCLLNEHHHQQDLRYAMASPTLKMSSLFKLADAFLTRVETTFLEEAMVFFKRLIALYRAHLLLDGNESKVGQVIATLLTGARAFPDVHRFAHDQLFADGVWQHVALEWDSVHLDYTKLLLAHFEVGRMASPREFWLARTNRTAPPIAVASSDLFMTLEGIGKYLVRVRSRETLAVVHEQDSLVRMFMNDELHLVNPLTAESQEYISTVCSGAYWKPPTYALTKLPPAIVIPCLSYAYNEARADQPDARHTLLVYALENFNTFCILYNICVDMRPAIFDYQGAAAEILRKFLVKTFFDRFEPYPDEPPVSYQLKDEVFNKMTMTIVDIIAPTSSKAKTCMRWLDTPTCSFVFDDTGPILCLLQQGDTAQFWYWSVLAMYHVASDYRIGFLETRGAVNGSDEGSVLVMYVSNSVTKFPPMEASAEMSVLFLGKKYAIADYTILSEDMIDVNEYGNFLPVLLRQWIESPGSMTWASRQRCLMWLSLARALFAPTQEDKVTPILSYNVTKVGMANMFEVNDLSLFGNLELHGDGYGLLVVSDAGYHSLASVKCPASKNLL